ncbi:ROK family protein [Neobacillus sp. OS1-2]|uniref:ROK family protein n=1 Tax=Neobacillus sp. OS1-2 TaxID=3070680 RepID=UPI0027DF8E4B|nr:ROK family protein [Neobacillus sp. OS1-2]WML41491.1 ROK family protein [Neobacillus sp. OS1-2]
MKPDMIIALDVGGTFIKGAVLENNSIIEDTMTQYDSRSNEDSDTILNHFVRVITSLSESYQTYKQETTEPFAEKTVGIGLAFPGPFDYENGISYIKGLNKFESLYGIPFRDDLTKMLQHAGVFQGATDVKILFENDGRLFGLGGSTLFPQERIISLTIGTGLGSVFIENGNIVKEDARVPAEGYLYNQLYNEKIVDEQFSRRGILQLASQKNLLNEYIDVKELAELARDGNRKALVLFNEFGANLGEMLSPFIEKFQPHQIIIGGQIGKSFDLFEKSLNQKIAYTGTRVKQLNNALHYTFVGIAEMFK